MERTDLAKQGQLAVHTLSGAVVEARDFVRPGGLSNEFRDALVLRGRTTKITPEVLGRCGEARIGTGSIGFGDADILTVRLQVDNRQVYWLADPADDQVWTMLDNWRSTGVAIIGLDIPPAGIALLKVPAGDIGVDARSFFDGGRVPSVRDVMEAMGAHVSTGALVRNATSDISAHEELASVEVLVLVSARMEQFMRDEGTDSAIRLPASHLH